MAFVYFACGLALLLVGCPNGSCAPPRLSLENTRVSGPGVGATTSPLPVNYFYIQARDEDGNNFSPDNDDPFHIALEGSGPSRLRKRHQVVSLGNGLHLVHYRCFSDHEALTISVTHDGKHVDRSPYTVAFATDESCACPLKSSKEWLEDFECRSLAEEKQILSSLRPFREGGINISRLYDRGAELYSHRSFIHYSIVDGTLYAQKFGSITGFKFLSDMILLSVVNKVRLPDMELLVNLGDWPLNTKGRQEPFPIFSWCGSDGAYDIIWPTWDLMKSTIMGLDRVTLSILTAQTSRSRPWEERHTKALFRGRDSNQARLDLVRWHRNETDLFDVGITNWFFFTHEEDVYGPKYPHISFHDFFEYKYQLNLDGTVAAYRFPYLLAGGSLVFKQDSEYYEHFYHLLEPWTHYVPLDKDVRDVREKLLWAMDNDDKAQEIAANAFQFVRDHLLPEHLYCYIVTLLQEYAGLQVGMAPRVHPDMEPVEPEVPHDCTEFCRKVSKSRKKIKKNKDEL